MNLEIWNALSAEQQKLMMDLSRAAQEKIREATESVDNFAKAKSELEPLGMTVVEAKVDEFRKVAQQKIWPGYKAQYGALWDESESIKACNQQRAHAGNPLSRLGDHGHGADHPRHRKPFGR